MTRALSIAAAAGCVMLFGAAFYISETQAIVTGGLTELKFETVKVEGGLIGAPTRMKITKQTIQHLRELMKAGKELTVAADGRITVANEPAGTVGNGKKVNQPAE
jgi:hypothetical protein